MSGVHGWFKPQNKNKNKSPAHSQTPKQELHSTYKHVERGRCKKQLERNHTTNFLCVFCVNNNWNNNNWNNWNNNNLNNNNWNNSKTTVNN